jgi:hypothetical protein
MDCAGEGKSVHLPRFSDAMESRPVNPLAKAGLGFFIASFLLGIPSCFAWFRTPFLISMHEFDFSLGLLGPGNVQSPVGLVIAGGLVHIGLILWLAWSYYRIVLAACGSPDFTGKDWRFCLALALPAFFYLPWLSPDVFYYTASGWMQTAYGMDPYVDLLDSTPDYPAHPVHWNNLFPRISTMYGPLFSIIMRGIMWLTEGGVIPALFMLKFLWLALHAASALVAGRIAARLGMNRRAAMFCILLNPVLLVSDLGCGHNDHIMLLVFLLAVLMLLENRVLGAVVILAIGAGFKYVPLILMPAFFTWFLRQDLSLGNFLRLSAYALLFCVLMILPNYLYEGGFSNFIRLLTAKDQQMVNPLYVLVAESAGAFGASEAAIKGALRTLFLLLYAASLLGILLRPSRLSVQDFCGFLICLLLVYFALGSSEIHEWYATWFFAFIFWVNRLSFFQAGIFFGCALQAFAIYTGHQMFILHRLGWTLMFVALWICLWHLFKSLRKDGPSPLFAALPLRSGTEALPNET